MQIIFLRHGESEDDLVGSLGGWSEPVPTKKGLTLAKTTAQALKEQYPDIGRILTSPAKRAALFAKELNKTLKLPLEENVYLKERNTYGLLNGLTLSFAKERYPEMYKRYNAQEFIPGSERYDDFKDRVKLLINDLGQIKQTGTLLCVTQGYLITTIIEEYLGLIRDSIAHGSYIVCELTNSKLRLKESYLITYLSSEKAAQAKQKKKFTKS